MSGKNEPKSDEYYRTMLEENPYIKVPQPENVRQVVDRYEHAKKDEACWQVKWDMIHCVLQSDCVQVQGRRARDCLEDKTSNSDVHGLCKALMTSLYDCRNSQLNARHRLKGTRTKGSHAFETAGGYQTGEEDMES